MSKNGKRSSLDFWRKRKNNVCYQISLEKRRELVAAKAYVNRLPKEEEDQGQEKSHGKREVKNGYMRSQNEGLHSRGAVGGIVPSKQFLG